MRQFMVTAQKYVRPFSHNTGVIQSGDDLRVEVSSKVDGESVMVAVVECINADRLMASAPQIIMKVRKGANVKIIYVEELRWTKRSNRRWNSGSCGATRPRARR